MFYLSLKLNYRLQRQKQNTASFVNVLTGLHRKLINHLKGINGMETKLLDFNHLIHIYIAIVITSQPYYN